MSASVDVMSHSPAILQLEAGVIGIARFCVGSGSIIFHLSFVVTMKEKMRVAMAVGFPSMTVQVLVDEVGPDQHLFIGEYLRGRADLLDPMLFRQ